MTDLEKELWYQIEVYRQTNDDDERGEAKRRIAELLEKLRDLGPSAGPKRHPPA